MKKIVTALALCLVATTASATDPKVWKDAPLAADQRLPHGLTLIPGNFVVTHPEQTQEHDFQKAFVIKVPSASGHESWWSDQYVQQLETLGWSAIPMPSPLKMLNRQKDQCREQMILIALGPNSHKSPMLKGSDMPVLEFDAVAFNYSTTGTCEP